MSKINKGMGKASYFEPESIRALTLENLKIKAEMSSLSHTLSPSDDDIAIGGEFELNPQKKE